MHTYKLGAHTGVRLASALLVLVMMSARADVVVVVGAKSPVSTLTKGQVADIYLGRTKDLPTGGAALTALLDKGPEKDEFLDKVLGKTEQQARAVWTRLTFTGSGQGPKELGSAADLKKLLANNPNVIGVINKSDVDTQVKVVLTL